MGSVASSEDVFRAVADPTRRALLDLLRGGERGFPDLASAFDISEPAVSQHLRVLREAGLVRDTRQGRGRLYRLDAKPLQRLCQWADAYREVVDPAGHVWRLSAFPPGSDHSSGVFSNLEARRGRKLSKERSHHVHRRRKTE
ncbi:MAG: metalloregulator ArsR/SmtB family transcription factor [Acidobacteriota bacterium]|nr:metalloregulator ArsR/SmtB family transcription factor [Acidobacteriota bacterium]